MKEWKKLIFLFNVVMLRVGRATFLMIAWTWMSHSATAQFGGGSGTETNPYQIKTIAHLDSIRNHNGGENYLDKHFVLMNDLDFKGYEYANPALGWLPIGHDTNNGNTTFNGTKFTGKFDGRRNVIRNLYINRYSESEPMDYVGLFGGLGGMAEITLLGLEAVNITGRNYVGGLVGTTDGSVVLFTVRRSYVTGRIEGHNYVGGLIGGVTSSDIVVEESYTATQVSGNSNVGGLIGKNMGNISNNYALGEVEGRARVGGLIGSNEGIVNTCYAMVSVEGNTDIGGLIGNNVGNCSCDHNYWNTTVSGLTLGIGNKSSNPDGVTGLTTDEMYVQDKFTGFSFSTAGAWLSPSPSSNCFPRLNSVGPNGQLLIFPNISVKFIVENNLFTLDYKLLPTTLSSEGIVFKSSDETVATVDNGEVTLIKAGEVTFTISRGGTSVYAPISASRTLFVVLFDNGTGTKTDPYEISTPAQLDAIRDNGNENLLDDHYVLTADIDFDGYAYTNAAKGWLPIAHDTVSNNTTHDGTVFTGSFNGQGHIIKNLLIDREEDYMGLFGYVESSATIDSLGMEELDITGRNNVGGVAGQVDGTIQYSYATGQVEGNNHVGGLAGRTSNNGALLHAYAVTSVAGTQNVGGLVGLNDGTIDTCYAAGAVAGTTNAGGLLGNNNMGTVVASYWNTETSGQATSAGEALGALEGLTTTEMDKEASFANWNFTDVWLPPKENVHFPMLRSVGGWQYVSIAADPASITEARDATFTLTRTGVSLLPLSPKISVTEQGHFLESLTPSPVMFAAGETTASLSMSIADDDIDEADGNVTATLKEGAGYTLIDDAKEATVSVTDNDLPKVNIAAEVTTVAEGTDVMFTLTREGQTTGMLSVGVEVTQQGDYISGTTPTMVDFEDGKTTVTLTVATDDDEKDEEEGAVIATLKSGTTYRLGDLSSAETAVTDNDLPKVSITAISSSVIEGANVIFTLTRTTMMDALTVNVEVTQQGDYISGTTPTTVDFSEGENKTTLAVKTMNDDRDEPSGGVTATVKQGDGYIVIAPASAGVSIADDDGMADPEVNMVAVIGTVTEGADAAFILTRTIMNGDLTVNVAVTEEGNYIRGTVPTIVAFADGEATSTLTVATEDDVTDEPNGVITATLKPGIGYIIGAPSSVEVSIADDDETEVSIAAVFNSITEGADATFTLTRTTTLDALTVNVEIIQQGNYIRGTVPTTVDFVDEEATATLTVATEDNATEEPSGVITATLESGIGYIISPPLSAEVTIIDNDKVIDPEVSITAVTGSVTEGADATFTLTRTTTLDALTVNVEVTQQGDFISGTTPTKVDFSEGENKATLAVKTVNDDRDEPSGGVTATVKQGEGYIVIAPSSAGVSIADDDGTADPEVNMVAVIGTVTEGADAAFTLTRTIMNGDLTVNVAVTEEGNYIRGTVPTIVAFADGEATSTLTVATEDDVTDEPNGVITATLKPGIGYIIGAPSSVEVSIADDDETEVSIAAVFNSITEGADATFTLTRTTTLGALSVNVKITQQGNYIRGTVPTTVDFANGKDKATLTVKTTNDDRDEPNGVITAKVNPGSGYVVGNTPSGEVNIADDDEAEVSIAATFNSITEGTDASFTLTRTTMVGALTVNVEVTQQGDYISISGTAPTTIIDFAYGETTATLTVATDNDEADEENGTIAATVKQGTGYTVGDPSTAEVSVTDNDRNTPVGISSELEAALYPNPVKGHLYVRLSQGGEVSIYTLSGHQEQTYHIHAKNEPIALDVSNLASGIYIITLTDNSGQFTHYRVVKE